MYPSWSLKRRYVPDMMIRCKREAGNIGLSLFLDTQSGLFAGVGEWGCLVLGLGVLGGGGGGIYLIFPFSGYLTGDITSLLISVLESSGNLRVVNKRQ